jgi:glycosyltransferase involved in cell wall biosynthesis
VRVIIDALQKPGHPRGIGRYVHGLSSALAQTPDFEVTVAIGRWHEPWYEDLRSKDVRIVAADIQPSVPVRHAWHVLALPRLAKRLSADVVHLAEVLPSAGVGGGPLVATIHDAAEFQTPETFGRVQLHYRRWLIRGLFGRADAIIAPSAHTADRLAPAGKPRSGPISVVHHGPGMADTVAELAPSATINEPYFLYVGALQRHKNVPRLVRAFREVAHASASAKPNLVLAGGRHNDAAGVVEAMARDPRIVHLATPTDEELAWLYSHAAAVVFPSIDEGFGFPILEAMQRGAPVITSSGGGAAEIAGGAALLVDALDEGSISRALTRILDDDALRRKLAADGRRRTQHFTWDACATQTIEVYRRALG